MKKTTLLLAFLFSFFTASAQIDDPVQWSAESHDNEATITAQIQAPWYMYDMGPYEGGPNATTFTVSAPEGVALDGKIETITKPNVKQDEIFEMEIGTYKNIAEFKAKFTNTTGKPQSVTVSAEYQVCAGETCLAPAEKDVTFIIQPTAAATGTTSQNTTTEANAETINETSTDVSSDVKDSVIKTEQKSLWAVIIEAILWGFAALLTPCVFPMVPMTVSFFIKNSDNKAKGKFLASLYGIAIVALYTLPIAIIILSTYIFGGEAVTADIFNWLATHWIPNVLFFVIFLIFAMSFFGAFEINMPSKLVGKSDQQSDKGGIIGTFFMATTLVLVSFSCTGPIVGTILVKSTQGEIWEPIITMIAFSAAFALPFTVFAFFPSLLKNLPKSGGWLNSVKVVLGFIELALGLKFLSVADQTYHWGLLDREVYLALWIVIFSLMGLYLLGKIRFSHDSKMETVPVKRLFMAIAAFTFVVYMIPGMWGAPLKALSGYLPPMHTMDFQPSQGGGANANASYLELSKLKNGKPMYSDKLHLPAGLHGFFEYNEALEYAKAVNKPLFLDFTGHGCVNCREMEANVWSDPTVKKILRENYVIVALYVDDKQELPEDQWKVSKGGKTLKTIGKINANWQIERFGVNAQPYYCLMNPYNEELIVEPRAYNLDVAGFIEFLESGLIKSSLK